jgi:hypothetical protein
MTCPYCPTPVPDREGAVTCGSAACRRKHHAYLGRQHYMANNGALNARRRRRQAEMQDGRCCQVCGIAFYVSRVGQIICDRSQCRNQLRELRRATRERAHLVAAATHLDLTTAQIDSKLAALAAHRRATRSWLRIEDPWAQRPGCALHQRVDVSTYDLEGALR